MDAIEEVDLSSNPRSQYAILQLATGRVRKTQNRVFMTLLYSSNRGTSSTR